MAPDYIRKPQVTSAVGGGGGGRTPCTLPLDPPLVSYAYVYTYACIASEDRPSINIPHESTAH